MTRSFGTILGQPKVREFLRTTVAQGRISHAYLFCGPAGSNKTQAAYTLAQAVICPLYGKGAPSEALSAKEGALAEALSAGKGVDAAGGGEGNVAATRGKACRNCGFCKSVAARKHPDVRYYAPEGANGYLVEQVRELVADVSLAPIQAKRKVYIIDRVDLLGTQAANAFLKTLEEPPADVVMILLGRTREAVLPTIVSRCQVIPFRMIPEREAVGIIMQNSAASAELSRMALAACGGSITRAIEFLGSTERLAFRRELLSVLGRLRDADDWDVLQWAKELVVKAKAPLDEVRADFERELEQSADFVDKPLQRQLELRNKRQLNAKTLELLHQLTAIVRSWLRDGMALCAQTPELVVNTDALESVRALAEGSNLASLAHSFSLVDRCDEAISYNVSPETCMDALLFNLRDEVLRRR